METNINNESSIYKNDESVKVMTDKDDELGMVALGCVHCGITIFTFSALLAVGTGVLKLTCPICSNITCFHENGIVAGRPLPLEIKE